MKMFFHVDNRCGSKVQIDYFFRRANSVDSANLGTDDRSPGSSADQRWSRQEWGNESRLVKRFHCRSRDWRLNCGRSDRRRYVHLPDRSDAGRDQSIPLCGSDGAWEYGPFHAEKVSKSGWISGWNCHRLRSESELRQRRFLHMITSRIPHQGAKQSMG